MIRDAEDPASRPSHPACKANVVWNPASVNQAMREGGKGHKGKCVWFTGLSGSGKSTLANELEVRLNRLGYHTMLLDGDNVRHGLCRDLGMSAADRAENIRRIGEVARLFTEAGLIVITAFISPFREDRQNARDLFAEGEFVEVHVATPLGVCEQRDPKGLYKKARVGKIQDFTGINSPYEPPLNPDVVIDTSNCLKGQRVDELLKLVV
ncbi:adenylyl-sulfate kinase [Halomonas sp. EGI 63088]|uniref:Adenylyl-sulfate kinase n=1 Tax=Halomonas flagellata TaxID=2920385 RepID=A0ABS9RSY8_9GAMM|nr:adenylyl-sulfate kinase [Halomonas flagellata]MCH4562970.1 adenylyl-sulfate kinase [Halomonas flagellata]